MDDEPHFPITKAREEMIDAVFLSFEVVIHYVFFLFSTFILPFLLTAFAMHA